MAAKKSLFLSYLFWLIGGIFGLHHFYLRRDNQVLIYWFTFGGCIVGWIRDLWRIPSYVQDINEDKDYMQALTQEMKCRKKPRLSWARTTGIAVVAQTVGYVSFNAIPLNLIPEQFHLLFVSVVPSCIAVGVYLIGNIGRHEANFWKLWLASYSTISFYVWNINSITVTVIVIIFSFDNYILTWRTKPYHRKPLWKRLLFLSFFGLIWCSLLASNFYFNCSIQYENDEKVTRCIDATKHFLNSPIFQEFTEVVAKLWEFGKTNGWKELWNQLIQAFDPHGYKHALKVFGLTADTATQQRISKRYRELSRMYHPDKYKDPSKRQAAQEKFIEINSAYEILSKIKADRIAKNIGNVENPNNCDNGQCSETKQFNREDL